MSPIPPSPRRAGFTLIELMIALVVLGLVMGAAVSVLRSQSSNFTLGGQRLELQQNMRYAVSTLDRFLRTTGAGTVTNQPMFVYGDSLTVAVNADYSDSVNSGAAVYVNPDAPSGSFTSLPVAQAYTLPNTAFTYPSVTYNDLINGTPGPAETIVFYFRLDSSTADPLDYVLMQKTNSLPAELVARNIYHYPGRPFLEYYVHPVTLAVPPAARDSLVLATNVAGMIPIRHTLAQHSSGADTNGTPSAVADSVKAVGINLRVTNGLTGVAQRFKDVQAITRLPNNGLVQLRICGSVPILTSALTVIPSIPVWGFTGDSLLWNPSADETAGERDVQQYNIYRRITGAPAWGPAIFTQPAGQATYAWFDATAVAGTLYDYGVGAVDCTPNESPLIVFNNANPL